MKVLILAGGRGQRFANGQQITTNKCLVRIGPKPLLEYSLENAAALCPEEIVLVVGFCAQEIINRYGNRFQAIPIRYVIQPAPQGVVHAMASAQEALADSVFMLFLGDEILLNARHQEMLQKFQEKTLFALCGVVRSHETDAIRQTYAIIQDEQSQICRLIEKPRQVLNPYQGTGNIVFDPRIFQYISTTPINPSRGEKELPDLIQCAVDDGHPVHAFEVGSDYMNINTQADLNQARSRIAYKAQIK